MPVDEVREVLAAHLLAELAQAVGDEPVVLRQQIRAHLGNLPPGKIAVNAVEKGAVVVELGWEGIEQVRGLQHVLHRVVDVALQHDGRIGVQHVAPAGVAARGHVILQDLHGIGVLEVHARHLVEGDAVPQAHQAKPSFALGVHAAEQVRRGGLSAGQKNSVGRDFLVDVRLARAPRPQLAEIVVALGQRHHALDEVQALLLGERRGLVARRAQEQRLPLLAGEVAPLGDHRV